MGVISSLLSTGRWVCKSVYYFINEQVNHYGGFNQAVLLPHPLPYLKYLLKFHKINKNHHHQGYTPLHVAAIFNFEQKKRIELLLNYGVNVNSQEKINFNSTPLHVLIANENTESAIFLMDAAKKKDIVINFNLLDINNCTILLLASKARQEKTALHILNQRIEGNTNIDIHMIDKKGMTALDYAIVLGLVKLTQKLMELGAQTNTLKPDLSNLSEFGGPVIRDMLHQMKIDPDRAANANLNEIHDKNKTLCVMATDDVNQSPRPHSLPIPSKKDPKTSELIHALQDPLGPLLDSSTLFGTPTYMSNEDKKCILEQYNGLSAQSLEDKCLENQQKIKKVFKEKYATSISFSSSTNFDESKHSKGDPSKETSQSLSYSYQNLKQKKRKEEKNSICRTINSSLTKNKIT